MTPWVQIVEAERERLQKEGVPRVGEASGWILMLSNTLAKAIKAFVDGDDDDGRKFLYRLAALATLWAPLLDEEGSPK
jgi:hypothetical protein